MVVLFIGYFFLWSTFLLMTLTIYRFKIEKYFIQILLCTIILTPLSVIIKTNAYNFLGILQLISVVIFFWLIFKVRFTYSLVMTVSVFLISGIPDLIVDYVYERFFNIVIVPLIPQISAIILFNIAITLICRRFRIGFSFIPLNNKLRPIKFTKRNIFMLISLVITVTIGTYFITEEKGPLFILCLFIIILFIIYVTFKELYIREIED
ncbi:hypothetical protein SY83_20900 [Paenibacillus swuensis]|uniref:Uncharacterized protein n=1 Tax=Paenibacillus swuensis TaxID=1178515 RepID=A0A172TMX3_9BACL|nr:hypothetical protein SY83_20900 [Paenibacillus swuensis]